MKNIVITISAILLCSFTFAQNNKTEKADKLFIRYEYLNAIKEYLKLVDNNEADAYVYKQLAEAYYNVFNSTEAVKWFERVIAEPQDAETYYKYAQMLRANGNYEESNTQMKKFAEKAPKDKRAIKFLSQGNYLKQLNKIEKLFEVKTLQINSDKSEFGGFLASDNTLYFASGRNETRKKYGWNNENFLDIYSSKLNEDGTFTLPIVVEELNSKYNDGPVTVSEDGNTLYFATESFREGNFERDKSGKLKFGKLGIFKAVKKDGKWTDIEPLPFNSKDYYNSNPSLSKDGSTLYFSSNMPGSLGGMDIWKVKINTDGSYGKPENLGPKVNTEGRESFPFIDDKDKLYFSSDSHNGFGGLDVYMINLKKDGNVINAGKPVNSEKDDFAFSYNNKKKMGFFSSNRKENDDLYQSIKIGMVNVFAKVRDAKTGKPILEADATLLENKKNKEQQKTNIEGKVNFVVDSNKENSLMITKGGYENFTTPINMSDEEDIEIIVDLIPIEAVVTEKEIILQEIYFEFDKSNITMDGANELNKLVEILKQNPKMEILVKSHTDSRGNDSYNFDLSSRRAKSTEQYIISKGIDASRITGKGFGETEPKVNCGDKCTEEEHAKNRRSEFVILKR